MQIDKKIFDHVNIRTWIMWWCHKSWCHRSLCWCHRNVWWCHWNVWWCHQNMCMLL